MKQKKCPDCGEPVDDGWTLCEPCAEERYDGGADMIGLFESQGE